MAPAPCNGLANRFDVRLFRMESLITMKLLLSIDTAWTLNGPDSRGGGGHGTHTLSYSYRHEGRETKKTSIDFTHHISRALQAGDSARGEHSEGVRELLQLGVKLQLHLIMYICDNGAIS